MKILEPMKGIRVWKNPKNKFCVFELHYTADPEKCSEEWLEKAKSGMPRRKWEQEYELRWQTFEGLPVYGDWNRKLHLGKDLQAHAGLPLLIGFDFGLTCAAVIAQLQQDQLVILKEYTSINTGAERFTDYLIGELRTHFPTWSNRRKDFFCFIDPAGTFRKDTDEGTCAMILDKKGFNPRPGPVAFEARKGAVEYYLTKMTKNGPCFLVDEIECPMIVKGFDGGYHYPEKALDVEAKILSPVKNMYSHPHDALQYICAGIREINLRLRRQVPPSPSYSWQKR